MTVMSWILTTPTKWSAPPTHMAKLGSLSCEFGLLERADGSARVVQGATSVLGAVYGPAEAKPNKEKWDK